MMHRVVNLSCFCTCNQDTARGKGPFAYLPTPASATRTAWSAFLLAMAGLMTGCVTTRPFEVPPPFDPTVFKNRAETTENEGIRVSATLIDADESLAVFGVDLVSSQIQPVWLEIENRTDRPVIFFPTGLDPEYFSPLEVSFRYHKGYNRASRSIIDNAIESLGLEYSIDARSIESGFVFTNLDSGSKFVTVDLIGDNWAGSYFLVLPTPDSVSHDLQFDELIQRTQGERVTEVVDETLLRHLLEELPSCATNKEGIPGEPLNLVLVGDLEPTFTAFIRRGYRASVMPPLYAFGRPQDVSGKKQDRWVASQPHKLRLWLTDIGFQGYPVWIAQASMPLGGRFGKKGDEAVQLPIDPDVDEVRNDIVQDLIYSQFVFKVGFVKGVGPAPRQQARSTPTGDTYHTDGLRAVLFFEREPVSLEQIEFLDWEHLASDNG